MKQNYIEIERGIEYMNYRREVAILTDFDKKQLKDPKMNKLIKKKPKIN